MKFSVKQLFLMLSLAVTGAANAGHLAGTDVPDPLLVDRNGNEWAWASPCSPVDPSCGGVLVMHHGFVNATAADFLADFTGFEDLHAALAAAPTAHRPTSTVATTTATASTSSAAAAPRRSGMPPRPGVPTY